MGDNKRKRNRTVRFGMEKNCSYRAMYIYLDSIRDGIGQNGMNRDIKKLE